MIKKVLGGLFFAGALFILVGSIANGSLFSDQGSVAATYGRFLGILIPIIVYVISGIFLLTFDSATKLNYIDGFKKRSKQASKVLPLIIVYGIFVIFTGFSIGASGVDNYTSKYLIAILPYIIPMCIFVPFYQTYTLTHKASKKYFLNSDSALNEYLSANETFYSWSDDNFVLASNKVLYFPTLFCAIPFNQIAFLKFYKQLGEQGVYINLVNGKKIYVPTKHFNRIQEAVNHNQQIQK